MQQLTYQIKYNLVTTNNDTNFPSYYNERPVVLLSNQSVYDLLNSDSYSSGILASNSELNIEKFHLIYLFSNDVFEYSIDDGINYISTFSFTHFNPKMPLNINIKNNISNVHYLYIN